MNEQYPAAPDAIPGAGMAAANPAADDAGIVAPAVRHPFTFTGSGSEYFRIWIVNLALTVLTLGIYSAWAKVRRLQYFYRNTMVAESGFDYHGSPIAILKGRLIAITLLFAYQSTIVTRPLLGVTVLVLLGVLLPWLIQRSLSFRLYNSSYRGLRFRFNGSVKRAYKVFLLYPVLAYITAFILAPFAHQRIKDYQHSNSSFGNVPFGFKATPGPFYVLYLAAVGIFLLLVIFFIVVGALAGLMSGIISADAFKSKDPALAIFVVVMFLTFYLALFIAIAPWFAARLQNVVWSNTVLGPHAIESHARGRKLALIYLTNFVLIALTLGLYKPFADIRLLRYRVECMALLAHGSLEEFLAGEQQSVSAVGEETTDLFDVDISF